MPLPSELLRRLVESFGAGGIEAVLPHVDPEVAWHAPPEWLEEQVYCGHDGLRRLVSYWNESFDAYRLELERVEDLGGNRALALLVQRGRIAASGAEVELPLGYLAEFRDELLLRVYVYFSWEATLEAAGAS